jgi:hypothetical protein
MALPLVICRINHKGVGKLKGPDYVLRLAVLLKARTL